MTDRLTTPARVGGHRGTVSSSLDPLTGLTSRMGFVAALGDVRPGDVVVVVDIDDMADLNDQQGVAWGDQLLVRTGQRLVTAAPAGAIVARTGGDEFAVWCRGTPADAVDAVARSLARGASGGGITVSAGAARALEADDDVFARASVALHQAKRRGRQALVVLEEDQRQRIANRRRLRRQLRGAADRGELVVHYQPVMALGADQLVGFEALVRWAHPELGLLFPDAFIELAERSGDIAEVDGFVLRQACRQLATWQAELPDMSVGMAVNVSAEEVARPGFAGAVQAVLEAADVPPASLCLELTESAVVRDIDEAATALRAVRATGVRVAVDDFGVGFGSLTYLRRFPLDHLKIDRSFVSGLGTDPLDTVLVASIVGLAGRLGVRVVAEGVETAEQAAELLRLGCPLAQGYHWGRPVPAAEATELVRRRSGRSRVSPWAVFGPIPTPTGGDAGEDADTAESVEAVTSFLTHELRSPLQAIGGFAQVLRHSMTVPPGSSQDAALSGIERQVARVDRLLASLRDVQAMDRGMLSLERVTVEVDRLVRQVVADVSPDLGERPVSVVAEAGVATVDPHRVTQVLVNLLHNAAKFSPAGAPVDVTVGWRPEGATSGRWVEVSVVDRGPGIAPERAADAFGRFVTLDRTRRGTGLGLYLSREIARAHGGDLTYRRAETGGACFTLTLPSGRPLSSSRSTGTGLTGTGSTGTGSTGTGLTGTGSTGAGLTGSGSTGAGLSGTAPTGAGPEGTGPSDRLPAVVRSAAGPRPAGQAGPPTPTTRVRRWLQSASVAHDDVVLRAVIALQQELLAATCLEAAVGGFVDLVAALGGAVACGEASAVAGRVVPVDLSLGLAPSLWATAEPVSIARVRLEAVLRPLVDDATALVGRLRRRRVPQEIDPVTAFTMGEGPVAGEPAKDLLVVAALPSADPVVVRGVSRLLRLVAGLDGCARLPDSLTGPGGGASWPAMSRPPVSGPRPMLAAAVDPGALPGLLDRLAAHPWTEAPTALRGAGTPAGAGAVVRYDAGAGVRLAVATVQGAGRSEALVACRRALART